MVKYYRKTTSVKRTDQSEDRGEWKAAHTSARLAQPSRRAVSNQKPQNCVRTFGASSSVIRLLRADPRTAGRCVLGGCIRAPAVPTRHALASRDLSVVPAC